MPSSPRRGREPTTRIATEAQMSISNAMFEGLPGGTVAGLHGATFIGCGPTAILIAGLPGHARLDALTARARVVSLLLRQPVIVGVASRRILSALLPGGSRVIASRVRAPHQY